MGFETLLLLCDVLRRPGRFQRVLCVCAVLAHLQGVWLCPGAPGWQEWGQGGLGRPSRSWQGLFSDLN